MADRLRVNKLALQVPAWVASAVARLTKVPVPSSFAVCVAMLAFGDELIDPELPNESDDESDDASQYQWLSPGGRDSAAAHLLPRAEAALHQELQRLADAVKRAREGQSSSSSGSQ